MNDPKPRLLSTSPVTATLNFSPLLEVNTRLLPAVAEVSVMPDPCNEAFPATAVCRLAIACATVVVDDTARLKSTGADKSAPVSRTVMLPAPAVPNAVAPLVVAPFPCTRVLRSAPVEAAAAEAVPVRPRLVDKVVVVIATAELELLPFDFSTIWLPCKKAVAAALNVLFAFRSLTIWPWKRWPRWSRSP